MTRHFSVVVPTLNAGPSWDLWLNALGCQNALPETVIVLDSQSTDATPAAAAIAGHKIVTVDRASFDHGGTRQLGLDFIPPSSEIVIYLTQDAVLSGDRSLGQIVAYFNDDRVGAAYGRQLPRPGATAIEAHARLFNYPAQSDVRQLEDKARLGLKAAFCSNSFAAYRRQSLQDVGGFPSGTIFAEDMITAALMLQAGWKIAYAADATVYHSHAYTIRQEFHRYFDIGVLHSRNEWLLNDFGKPTGEGMRFVKSELAYLARHAPFMIPGAMLRTLAKYAGYRLGQREKTMSVELKHRLSMNKSFWKRSEETGLSNAHKP